MPTAKTVLITGASIGIGHATAELFQSKGWNVVATMRNPAAAMTRDISIQDLAMRPNVLVTALDVTDEASIEAAVDAAIARFGKIDVLVNNAGYGLYGILEATTVEQIRQQFETNVIGLLATTKAVVPHFRKQHSGVIVNISSIGGLFAIPASAPYCGTKFAVEGISEGLTHEMRTIGVRVKLIEPGFIKTNFGNAMTFANDTSIPEYQPLVADLFKTFASMAANAADPLLVAEVIYRAATDGTNQLRYLAGADAEEIQTERKSLDDAEFLPGVARRFGL